jgi:hypothetical protein
MILVILVVLALASHSADSRLSGGEHDCAKFSLPARSPFWVRRTPAHRGYRHIMGSLRRPSRMALGDGFQMIEL